MKMPASSDIFLFADFRFDRAGGGLFRRGDCSVFAPVTIGARALDLLAVLIERRGDVVSKEEMMAAVWPRTTVEEANLFVQISALRAILDKEQSGQSCIQTVTGRGYRFIAPVTRCGLRSTPAEVLEPTHRDSVSNRGDTGPPRLSIVVLPFANIGGDPEQEYFADGVTESLTTDLSRISGAFVIGRNTAFTYKGKAVDLKQIGRDLNVRYVLEGSVQRDANRMRISAQLIEAETSAHLWAERFDKPLGDLLQMQDEVVARLGNAVAYRLTALEARRVEREPNPESADLHLQGWALMQKGISPDSLANARRLFERALTLNPDNIQALVGVAHVDLLVAEILYPHDRAARFAAAEAALTKALSVAPEHAFAHLCLGIIQIHTNRILQGIRECERALELNQNLAIAHAHIGLGKLQMGRAEETETHIREALRLSPNDVTAYLFHMFAGLAELHLGKDVEAVAWLRRSIEASRSSPMPHFFLAAALAHRGQLPEARAEVEAGLAINPTLTISRMRAAQSIDNPAAAAGEERVIVGLRMAGLPEG
jgi:TolB-like protein